ncbi:MAG TPA: tetratricopeptide repeat protein [Kofleriaceae bacterium]|nr:tetratricopeptide repeat protein [Kofleriaceae bacterium]
MLAVLAVVGLCGACDDLDGRGANRKANRYFRETKFIEAASLYERALKKVEDPKIHYNLGLAYSKIFKAGVDDVIVLGQTSEDICKQIPDVKVIKRRVCIKNDPKEEDRGFNKCDEQAICPSSATCTEAELCAKDNPALANLAAEHLTKWIDSQPSDDEIKKQLKAQQDDLDKLEKAREKADAEMIAAIEKGDKIAEDDATQRKTLLDEQIKAAKNEVDETALKFTMRKLMTQLWIDSNQFDKAIAYWDAQLKAKPNDLEVMGNLAGINLKAGDWRKSIDWYQKVAAGAPDETNKLSALQFIGNVAWAKLNSKTLPPNEAIELADLGIGALQEAHKIAPKNVRFLGLQSSIYNFRSLIHGASWAAAIDRASSQDLKGLSDVVSGKAKPAAPGAPTPPTTPPKTDGAKTSGGPADKKAGG